MNYRKIPNSLKIAKFHALEILEKYNIKKLPVDINKILKDFGLNIEEINFPEDINHISGMLDIENKTIFVNRNDADTRKAFTVAHELGHYIMHKEELERDDSYAIVYRKDNNNDDLIEKEANAFAANLLAPKFLLDNFVKDFTSPQLAKLFGVSEQMIEIRITNEYP